MLQHVVEAQKLDLVLGRVDAGIAVGEVGLDDKGGRVAVFTGGGVVGAGVAAFRQHVGDVAVLGVWVALSAEWRRRRGRSGRGRGAGAGGGSGFGG